MYSATAGCLPACLRIPCGLRLMLFVCALHGTPAAAGSSVVGFQATQADAFCAQLLRLTGDSAGACPTAACLLPAPGLGCTGCLQCLLFRGSAAAVHRLLGCCDNDLVASAFLLFALPPAATCKVVSVVSAASPAGRRLLAGETVHVIAGMETKNADATVAALNTDTVFTLLAPAGITVVPGSVKAGLGAPVLPQPAVEAAAPATNTAIPADSAAAATETDASSDAAATEGGSSGGGSSIGPIIGGVVGGLAAAAIIAAIVVVVSRCSVASSCICQRLHCPNPSAHHCKKHKSDCASHLFCLQIRCPPPSCLAFSEPACRQCAAARPPPLPTRLPTRRLLPAPPATTQPLVPASPPPVRASPAQPHIPHRLLHCGHKCTSTHRPAAPLPLPVACLPARPLQSAPAAAPPRRDSWSPR